MADREGEWDFFTHHDSISEELSVTLIQFVSSDDQIDSVTETDVRN